MSEMGSAGRLAIVHIGPMKTGTTSIQWWLSRNSGVLEAQGIQLLRPKTANASPLARTFDEDVRPRRRRPVPGSNDVSQDDFTDVLNAIPDHAHTCILTGELLGQVMRRPAIARFKQALAPFFDRWLIIAYLRRQADLAASRFSTTSRRGQHGQLKTPLDYARMLEDWGAEFGQQSLRPRLFDRAELINGDVVADFCATAGLPPLPNERTVEDHNRSLTPAAQAFLEALGKRIGQHRHAFLAKPAHDRLIGILDTRHAGPGRLPSRSDVIAFMDQARASNERVRATWFPEKAVLFSEDYSMFPEVAMPPPGPQELLDVAMDVLLSLLADQDER